MLVETECNLCGGEDFIFLKKVMISPMGGESNLVKCKGCGLTCLNPRYNEEDERKFYASEYFGREGIEAWSAARVSIFKYNLKMLNTYKKGGKLLDLGCGMGQFLKIARDDGWDVMGIDISMPAAEYARLTFGIEIIESSLEGANFKDDFFDVVTAFNIIDQLRDPLKELKEIRRVLKENGIISIRVLNLRFHIFFDSLLKFINRINSIWADIEKPPAFHNYMFNRETATAMLKKAGFKNITILNSRLCVKNKLIEGFILFICQSIYYLTFKRCILTPSLLIFAEKT